MRGGGTNPAGMAGNAPDPGHPDMEPLGPASRAWQAYRMRWKRRRLLIRSFRKSRDLHCITPRPIPPTGAILAFSVMRNEALRLPYWLAHHRRLGVAQFVIVDNGSDDGTAELLAEQPDVSLWTTEASYKASRFGVDWLNFLMRRFGAGHWCLVADADELLIYPHWEERPLQALAAELDRRQQAALGTLMVELYPRGPVSRAVSRPGDDPTRALPWFDAYGYRSRRQRPAQNLWVQGGPRDRVFFQGQPRRAPTLNKLVFIRWRRGYAWLNSSHSALPPRLNLAWDGPGDPRLSGALLHTKFLSEVIAKATEEQHRRQHFGDPGAFEGYYAALRGDPDLWCESSVRFEGWRQLEDLGLLARGGWD